MNQTVSVPRDAGMAVFPSCGHGQGCSQEYGSATRHTDGEFLVWLISKALEARLVPVPAKPLLRATHLLVRSASGQVQSVLSGNATDCFMKVRSLH